MSLRRRAESPPPVVIRAISAHVYQRRSLNRSVVYNEEVYYSYDEEVVVDGRDFAHCIPAPKQPVQFISQTLRPAEVQRYNPKSDLIYDQERYFLFDQKIDFNGIQYTNRVRKVTPKWDSVLQERITLSL
jgi:hypothetical protein